MTFGLLVIPLTAFIGLAVDFGKVYSVNSHTQSALDAAALAAGRVAQVETSDVINKASAAASAYFDQSKPTNVVKSTIEFSPNAQNTQFTVTATSWVRTPFLGVLNSLYHQGSQAGAPAGCQGNYFGCVPLKTTATAELKVGGNGGSNVEVSLMLDVTGSMCTPCTKIDAIQVGRQGPDRHRHLGGPEPVHLQDCAGAVRRGRQCRHGPGAAGARHGDRK